MNLFFTFWFSLCRYVELVFFLILFPFQMTKEMHNLSHTLIFQIKMLKFGEMCNELSWIALFKKWKLNISQKTLKILFKPGVHLKASTVTLYYMTFVSFNIHMSTWHMSSTFIRVPRLYVLFANIFQGANIMVKESLLISMF